ncbi:MAG: ABC transporter permease [Negativicutes bacterium]|nr:ABC transporter permease [Negativicutes bacterium]
MTEFFAWLGRRVISGLAAIGRFVGMIVDTGRCLWAVPRPGHVTAQMAHLGADSLPIVALTSFFTGMVMTLQMASKLMEYGAGASVGGIVAVGMGRELAPVLTGVVCAGRVGAAIAAEIGTMKVTEQIDALIVLATNPIRYLVVPRLLACMLMLPVLTVMADFIGVSGGYVVAAYLSEVGGDSYLQSIDMFAGMKDMIGGLAKTVFFGAIIAVVGSYMGLNAPNGAEGVGRATTRAVVAAMVLIFFSNFFLSWIIYGG